MTRTESNIVQQAYVVTDIDKSIRHWLTTMAVGPFFRARFRTEQQVYRGRPTDGEVLVAATFIGDLMIELIQQVSAEESVFQEVLRSRGPGPHHVLLKSSAGFDAQLEHFKSCKPDAVAFTASIPGVARMAYIDMLDEMGCFIELSDRSPAISNAFAGMVQACKTWDGVSDPVREFPRLVANP